MWPDGSWSSIAEKASPGKEIIHPGWTRRLNAWLRKKSRKPSDRKHWNGNWSGYAWLQKHVMPNPKHVRSEEHTSELQSLMRISYAVFCLKKKRSEQTTTHITSQNTTTNTITHDKKKTIN